MMIRMVTRMRDAAEKDAEANKKREPAIAKLRLLPKVQEQLQKTQFADQFLDNNLLGGIKAWLEPLPDGSLPSLDIQKVLIKALSALPVQTLHLRESGLV
jgi:transcription factor SPN1